MKIEAKHDLKNTIRIVTAAELMMLFLFLGLHILVDKKTAVVGIVYGCSTLIVFYAGYRHISKRINQTMKNVNDTIQALLDNDPIEPFSIYEDNLLGKFQMQILKMHHILNAGQEREQKLREQISELTGDLVHQINTPITNIILYCGLLDNGNLDSDTLHTFHSHIIKQAEKLKWFGENFAKVARLETGIMQLYPKIQPFLPILLNAADQVSLHAELKHIEIIFNGNGLEAEAYFDYKWTEEAIYSCEE